MARKVKGREIAGEGDKEKPEEVEGDNKVRTVGVMGKAVR
jgi:hypothetical protein